MQNYSFIPNLNMTSDEFWGETGYDSRPYVEVTGVLTQKCWCQATLTISPTY